MSFNPFRRRRARQETPASPEQGIHQWLPRAAAMMRLNGTKPPDVIKALHANQPGLRRPFQPGEVEQAVAFVYGSSARPLITWGRRRSQKPSRISPRAAEFSEAQATALIQPSSTAWTAALVLEGQSGEHELHTAGNGRQDQRHDSPLGTQLDKTFGVKSPHASKHPEVSSI